MKKSSVLFTVVALVMAISLISAPAMGADEFPEQEINIIVPFAPGGGTDVYVRNISSHLEEELGVPVVVENIEGAASLRGIGLAHGAEPDGYTLIAFNPPSPHMAIATQGAHFTVDEFELIGGYAMEGPLLSVHPDQPYETFEEVQEAYREGEIELHATQSEGTILHISTVLAMEFAELEIDEYIPYPGSGEIIAAMIREEAPTGISTAGAAIDHIADGSLRPIVFMGHERYPGLPDVPSIAELGYEEAALPQFRLLAAPEGTPEEIVDTLENALLSALEQDELLEWAEEADRPVEPLTGEQVTQMNEDLGETMEFLQEEGILD